MVAKANLWVYNAKIFCVSFFNQVTSILLRRGENKNNVFLGLPIGDNNSVLADCDVERVFKKLLSTTTSEEVSSSLQKLRPASVRKLIQELSQLAEKDAANITFELDPNEKKGRSVKISDSSSTHWLFPYDFRKLDDLPESNKVEIIAKRVEILPKNYELKLLTRLSSNVISLSEMNSLQKESYNIFNISARIPC